MRNLILVLFLIVAGIDGYAQSKVVYIIPDNVESAIEKQIILLHNEPRKEFIYFILAKDDVNSYRLSLVHNPSKVKKGLEGKALKSTNRVLLINQTKYPLVFDYDFAFGTPKEDQVGTFGKREGNVMRSAMLFHGYTIYFNRSGVIHGVSEN